MFHNFQPNFDSVDFSELYHPLYGRCLVFQLNQESLKDIINEEGGVDSVYFALNTEEVPSTRQMWSPPKQNYNDFSSQDATLNYHAMSADLTERELTVFLYQEGSFYSSRIGTIAKRGSKKVYLVEQEVIDRSQAPGKGLQCKKDEGDNDGMSEDDCLYNCLRKKFKMKFDCDHARLRRLFKGEILEVLDNDSSNFCRWEQLKARLICVIIHIFMLQFKRSGQASV